MFRAPAAFRISLMGMFVILTLVALGALQPAVRPCGGLAANYAPIIAFELSRSVADLHALFGATPSSCRTAMAARMDLTNWIDSFLFIPAYGVFVVFFLLGVRDRNPRLFGIAINLTVVACLADYLENTCLFQLSGAPDAPSVWLSVLPWATGTKWIGLGMIAGLAGWGLAAKGGAHYAALLLGGVSFFVTVLAIADPHRFGPYASDGVILGWLMFLFYDAANVLRPRAAA